MSKSETPAWACVRQPDEAAFCWDFYQQHNLTYQRGHFYDINGCVDDEDALRQEIYRMIKPYYSSGLQSKVENLLQAMRLELRADDIRRDVNLIHVANGTVDITGDFYEHKHICPYRLPVRYDPSNYHPQKWMEFIRQLLEPEDIDTLQEFMGYCLLPTNVAQKMLLVLGEGGEGKSRIGVVMRCILGKAMKNGSISKVEHDRFARADLEDVLLMVDDDLKMDALASTNYIKSIITADTPLDLERKGQQSYQGVLHCRLLAFGNGSLQALHDRSYGFFRRQIILKAKPKDPNRLDDPFLGAKLAEEADSIFYWSLIGLRRLLDHDFQFTISSNAKENWDNVVKESNNIVAFFGSTGYFRLEADACASSKAIYEVYQDWCRDNALRALGSRTFWQYLSSNAYKYDLTPSNHIPIGNGRQGRGFYGIHLMSRF